MIFNNDVDLVALFQQSLIEVFSGVMFRHAKTQLLT